MGLFDRFKKKEEKKEEKKVDGMLETSANDVPEAPQPKAQAAQDGTAYRYHLEHRLLPEWILGENGAAVISNILIRKGEFFITLYKSLHEDEADYVCPYSPEDFQIRGVRLGENSSKMVLHIQMPAPERTPLCKMVFIVHDEKPENRRYLTAEMSFSDKTMLCEWRNGTHSLYGEFSEELFHRVLMD